MDAQDEAEKFVVPNQFTDIAERNGAEGLNAETGLDDTSYYWSMPENRLELWAWMESSRLSDVVPREFYKERDVVMEERRMRTDSNPIGRLVEQFLATAYVAHNYGRSSIGWPSEVSQINATEAMEFHKKYYVGANIVVAIVGDVKAAEAMPMLEKYFSKVPGGPKPEEMTTVEPKQFAEKSVVIREQTQPFYIEGYHRPSYRDPDDAVYDAIQDIMSNGRVSRLYRSLVRDQQIAAEAEGFSPFPGDKYPGLFAFYAVPLPGHTPAQMREAIHKEIEKLKTADVTDAELAMYKTRARADLLRSLGNNQGLANALAEYQTRYGDWRELFLQLDRVDKVTKADIRRVANQVFVASEPDQRGDRYRGSRSQREERRRGMKTSAQGSGNRDQMKARSTRMLAVVGCTVAALLARWAFTQAQESKPWEKIPAAALHDFRPQEPQRIELKNGIVLFLQEDHELPFVSGSVLIPGGSRDEDPAKAGLIDLYGQAWRTSGTEKMDGDAMDDLLEAKAAHIETAGDVDSTALSWDSLKGDADQVYGLAIDLLFHPQFRAEKLQLAQQQEATGIVRRNDDEGEIANREAVKLVYGANGPVYARQPEIRNHWSREADRPECMA